jgi:iron complex outermembrane recepter protein
VVPRPVRFLAVLSLTLLATTRLAAQAGTLQGTVSDSGGTTLPNASVTVEGTGLRATTGSNGGYELRGVPAGTYTVRVRLIGFQAGTEQVTVPANDVVRQDFTLGRSTVQLAPIDVVVGSRARHTAAEELAVPVDIFPAEQLAQQGSTETSVILQAVSPSINCGRSRSGA